MSAVWWANFTENSCLLCCPRWMKTWKVLRCNNPSNLKEALMLRGNVQFANNYSHGITKTVNKASMWGWFSTVIISNNSHLNEKVQDKYTFYLLYSKMDMSGKSHDKVKHPHPSICSARLLYLLFPSDDPTVSQPILPCLWDIHMDERMPTSTKSL